MKRYNAKPHAQIRKTHNIRPPKLQNPTDPKSRSKFDYTEKMKPQKLISNERSPSYRKDPPPATTMSHVKARVKYQLASFSSRNGKRGLAQLVLKIDSNTCNRPLG